MAITDAMLVGRHSQDSSAWKLFAVAARRLERQAQDPDIAQQALATVEKLFSGLSPEEKQRVPAMAARSAALSHFLEWRELPRAEKTTVVDLRARAATEPSTPASTDRATLLASAARADRLAYLSTGKDKLAWLYRSARMLIVADRAHPNDPDVRAAMHALSSRFLRHGETQLGQALDKAAEGDRRALDKAMLQKRAQLGTTPANEKSVRFGKVVAEHTKNAAGASIVKINGAEISLADWQQIEAARDRTLARYRTALTKPWLRDKAIDGLDALRRFITLGRSAFERSAIFSDKSALREMRAPLVEQLKGLKAEGKRVLIYVEGHDAAGKGSASQTLLMALHAAGYESAVRSFKAPTAEERKQHWLERFQKSVDENPGVLVWDRGPAGNWAYGPAGEKELAELHAFEAKLKQDTVVIKLNLRAEPERQTATFGKRWARALIAEELLESPGLSAQEGAGLQAIVDTTLSPNDLPAYAAFGTIDGKFKAFTAKNAAEIPWHAVDTSSRAVAREQALAILAKALPTADR
ncbi:MAG: hypothetical protein IT381_09950 [Deltaproteobacteria bacterium]|nr:hypothetical protein [Deltaproteobacteria bacterium]